MEDFGEDFQIHKFLDHITHSTSLKESNEEGYGQFNPTELKEIMIKTREKLAKVEDELDSTMSDQSFKCSESQEQLQSDVSSYLTRLNELRGKFGDILQKYSTISEHSESMGNALRILDEQKSRALKTKTLLSNFIEFSKNENHMMNIVNSENMLIEGSEILRDLLVLCEGLDRNQWGATIDRINKRVQDIRNNLMDILKEATLNNDMARIATVAASLASFQQGNGVYDAYVQASIQRMANDLPKPESEIMTKDDCFAFLGIYINKSTNLFTAEIDTLYNVFEGKTIVDVCISLLKKYATDVQIGLSYLRYTFESMSYLAPEDLLDLNVSIQEHIYIFYESTLRYLEDKEAVEKNVYIDNLKEMEKEIYTKLDDVNEAYLMQYKNDEKNSLISICQSTVTPILLIPYDSNSQKNDIKYMVKAYLQENGDDKNQFITDTMNNSLSPMGVITILKAFSDIIGRVSRLYVKKPQEGAQVIADLADTLFSYLGDHYFSVILDSIFAVVENENLIQQVQSSLNKTQPGRSLLIDVIQSITGVVYIIQQNYQSTIQPFVINYPDEDTQVSVYLQTFYIGIERKIVKLLESVQKESGDYISYLFGQYVKKSVFNPSETVGITRPSDICYSLCGYIKKHIKEVSASLDGYNLNSYIESLISIFSQHFLDMFMKTKKINSTGILLLELDLSHYEETMNELKIESAISFLVIVRKLTRLLSTPLSLLRKSLLDNDLLNLNRELLVHLLSIRLDSKDDELKAIISQLEQLS